MSALARLGVAAYAIALGAVVAGAGCGPNECLDAAEAAAQERVERECPGSFDSCPARDAILADLQARQEACP